MFVEFNINGKNLQYTYTSTHLSGDNCENNAIFNELKVNKFDYCSQAYGYPAKSGAWPRCNEGDYAALHRLVTQIQKDCEAKQRKYAFGNVITFCVNGKDYHYKVHHTFCSGINCSNTSIFHAIGLESDEEIDGYCAASYGYEPAAGAWPFCNDNDYEALERLIDKIFLDCIRINRGDSFKAYVKIDNKLPFDEPKTIAEKATIKPFPDYGIAIHYDITETTLLLPKKHKNTAKF